MPTVLEIQRHVEALGNRITNLQTTVLLRDLANCADTIRQPVLAVWLRDLAETHTSATIGPNAGKMHERIAPKLRQLSLQFPTDSTEALICAVAHQILAPWAKLAEG